MKTIFVFRIIPILCLITGLIQVSGCRNAPQVPQKQILPTTDYIEYIVNPQLTAIELFWKDDSGKYIQNAAHLNQYIESKNEKLLFAMNAGMYCTDNSPLGLFIQDQKIIKPLNTSKGEGNFYLQPNGIFYITGNNKAIVCTSHDFKYNSTIQFATQSGPMLVINNTIHPSFKKGSTHLNIRNGVGILPNNSVLFVQSKKEVSLYDFAMHFKTEGCKNALYLDGFVSRTYLPEQNWVQTDGNFGVMIGVVKK